MAVAATSSSTGDTSEVRPPFLLTLKEGVSAAEIEQVGRGLPASVSLTPDFEVGALVIRWGADCDCRVVNATHAALSASGLVRGGPGSEEAVRRYMPKDDRPPSWAMWENGHWAIMCERCRWMAHHVSEQAAITDCERHDREVHGER